MTTDKTTPTSEVRPLEFFDKVETAKALHASVRQIERWTANGRLGHVRLGLKTLYTPDQINAFVASCTVDPTA
jgi:hypothetical protein